MADEHRLLWVQRLDGTFAFVPAVIYFNGAKYSLNHTAASRGANVLSAGEAIVNVSTNGRVTIKVLNNQSGHYTPSSDTLKGAKEGLERLGFGVLRVVPVAGT